MKLSISAYLFACLAASALFSPVQAGWCDSKIMTGSYCRDQNGGTYSTRCVCTTKKDKKTKKYEKDCDNEGEQYCYNGCSSGKCKTASQVCATTNLDDLSYNDGTTTFSLAKQCPAVVAATFRTWKNRQGNSDAKEQPFLQLAVENNKVWTKATMLPKFYDPKAQGIAAMGAAWDASCKSVNPQQYYCLRYFPKCQNNAGSSSQCQLFCEQTMKCPKAVEAACTAANTVDPTLCISYSTFGPNDGRTDCSQLCDEYQNDKLAAGSAITISFVAIVTALIVAFA